MRRPWYRNYLPGWIVTGGGGSGGAATVQTDGVTLQGDGSSGNKIRILQVETAANLSGAGTLASPLTSTPMPWWNAGQPAGNIPLTGNAILIAGFFLERPVTIAKIWLSITVADNSNNNDAGFYSADGSSLICHIGAQHIASTGIVGFAIAGGGSVTLQPGLIWTAATSAASTFSLQGASSFAQYASTNTNVSAGGALPASITVPASPTPAVFGVIATGCWLGASAT